MPESLGHLFVRFLRFGLLAWGGPFAQIAMIKGELVDREKWITSEKFNRVLAVYQALPGPEAHELCCYFGMLSRGRTGAIVAGLGFLLPGLILMLIASALYVRYGLSSPLVIAAFAGMQPAVAALMIRAVHRIGRDALRSGGLVGIAFLAFIAQAAGVHFGITLGVSALLGAIRRERDAFGLAIIAAFVLAIAYTGASFPSKHPTPVPDAPQASVPTTTDLATLGLKAGLLSFGGAYTAVPIVQRDAIAHPSIDDGDGIKPARGWMTRGQFLDGMAISGVLPAPFIIFTTFVGYFGGGWIGALVITACVFLPAFAFTLLGHRWLERAVENKDTHAALDGVTAGVVGIIAVTTLGISVHAIQLTRFRGWPPVFDANPVRTGLLIAALIAVYAVRSRWTIPGVILGAALVGVL